MEEMDLDEEQSTRLKVEALQDLVTGPLTSSIAKLSGSIRGIPSEEDFHFYYNFTEFKDPVKELSKKSESLLKTIGGGGGWASGKPFPNDPDDDDVYDWLVDINDQLFERFDASMDEFQRLRKEREDEDGFQFVCSKKKKKAENMGGGGGGKEEIKMGSKDMRSNQPRVPFHIPTITRPQDQFRIVVDNSNEPFQHVWLEKSEDGSRFIHPLETFSEQDFVDRNIEDIELVKPLPIESTPFKMVEDVEQLKELASKLCEVNEFAVDLEHNQYRSFQGLTCLMQISTRVDDFVVDTLKLRAQIGPYLRDVFKDPSKKKIMHGADRDILWLQRDFGVYVCNMFDTGQASRILQLERNSLEYLLHHFCGFAANKLYQNADWRLRPIPSEMLKYAREDTHYLLHIYDLMKVRLLTESTNNEGGHDLLTEVYKRSYDICMRLYEKDILTETSYLHIYGLQGADFNSEQVAVVAALCKWRDAIARAEDESTGYILPNKVLLEIARLMPDTAGKLRQLVRLKHPYVERNLGSVVSIIKKSIQNASAFEEAVELLKKAREELAAKQNMSVVDESGVMSAPLDPISLDVVHDEAESLHVEDGNQESKKVDEFATTHVHSNDKPLEQCTDDIDGHQKEICKESFGISRQLNSTNMGATPLPSSATEATVPVPLQEATVEVSRKPSRAFGALLGKPASKKKLNLDPKAEIKVEQIKSSVTFQFQSFPETKKQSKPTAEESIEPLGNLHAERPVAPAAGIAELEDIIPLENDGDSDPSENVPIEANNSLEHTENVSTVGPTPSETEDRPMSLSELSSSFQKCLHSVNEKRNTRQMDKSQESDSIQLKPFDYAVAREYTIFGEDHKEEGTKDDGMKNLSNSKERRRKSSMSRGPRDEGTTDIQSVRRRQAFPHTGNRNVTFR